MYIVIECTKKFAKPCESCKTSPFKFSSLLQQNVEVVFTRGRKIDTSGLRIADPKHVFYPCEAISIHIHTLYIYMYIAIDNLETLPDNFW